MIGYLPELVVEIIIGRFLNYEDLINLKLTCKGLKNIVDRKKFKNLFVFLGYPYPRRLFYTNEQVGYANSLRIEDPNSKILNELSIFKETFNYLQKLIFYSMSGDCLSGLYTKFSLEKLNCFEHLEHLELHDFNFVDGDLSLKNLKIFSLDSNCTSELDCEQLKAINIEERAIPKFTKKTASSLTHLSFGIYIYPNEEYLNSYLSSLIEICENLSVLTMKGFGNENTFLIIKISENKLKIPSLKEIRMEMAAELPDFEVLIQCLKKPFSPLKKVKIFLNGKLLSLDEFIKLDIFAKKITKFSNLPKMINEDPLYDCLLDSATSLEIIDNSKLNKQSIAKLKNVRYLTFSNKLKIDDELWEAILETWKNKLEDIDFYYYMTQNQVDQMPDYFTNKISLMFGIGCKFESHEFLSRFKNLIDLRLNDQEIKKDDLIRLLKKCCWLQCIQFSANGERYGIGINRQKKYFKFFDKDRFEKNLPFESYTLETLVDYCYSSKRKISLYQA